MSKRRISLFAVGLFILLAVLAVLGGPAYAQTGTPINYGDTVNGEVKAKPNDGVFYSFTAAEGDEVSATMVRTSGTLKPAVGLIDLSKSGKDAILAVSKLSSDSKTATLAAYTIKKAGTYYLLATWAGSGTAGTTGKYTLTFEGTGSGGNSDQPTDTPEVTDTPVATPRPKATIKPTTKPSTKPTATKPSPKASPTPVIPAGVDLFQVGTSPSYSVWSGNNLYVMNTGDGTVSVLDSDGNLVNTIQAGGVPFAGAWDGARLWVADIGTNSAPGTVVSVFDNRGKKLGSYKVGSQPFSISADTDDKLVWVALFGDNKIVGLDPKGKVSVTVDTSGSGNNPNTVLWAGGQLWATLTGTDKDPGNTVLLIGADGTINQTFTVGKSPADLAWDDTDQIMFVANYGDNSISALNTDGTVVGTYPVGKNPGALAWDGNNLWVSLAGDNAVAQVNAKGEVQNTVPLPSSPNGVTFDGMGHIWVALQGTTDKPGNQMARIDVTAIGQ